MSSLRLCVTPFECPLRYDAPMWRLVYWGFIAVGLVVVWMTIMQPRRFRQLGKNARTIGYAYVAAILISAVLRLAGVWGT